MIVPYSNECMYIIWVVRYSKKSGDSINIPVKICFSRDGASYINCVVYCACNTNMGITYSLHCDIFWHLFGTPTSQLFKNDSAFMDRWCYSKYWEKSFLQISKSEKDSIIMNTVDWINIWFEIHPRESLWKEEEIFWAQWVRSILFGYVT